MISCAGLRGYESKKVEGIKIIKVDELKNPQDYKLEIAEKQIPKAEDTTKTLEDLLRETQNAGALLATDIYITIRTAKEKCITYLAPEEEIKSKYTTVNTPGQTVSRSVLKPVTRSVTEYEYRCTSVSKPVQKSVTRYESQYDYYSKSYRSVPRTVYVTEYQYQNDCKSVPVTKMVTRYEYQYESQYIPPRTDYISKTYSEWKIVESEPICSELDSTDQDKQNTIHGKFYIPKKQ